jgi:hypothetical protein
MRESHSEQLQTLQIRESNIQFPQLAYSSDLYGKSFQPSEPTRLDHHGSLNSEDVWETKSWVMI